jgi:WD40 repeat protein
MTDTNKLSGVGITDIFTKQYRGYGFMTIAKYNNKGDNIYFCDKDSHVITIIDTKNYQINNIYKSHTGVIWDIDLTLDDKILVSCSGDLSIIIWDTTNENIINKISTAGIPKYISINKFNENNYLLVYNEGISKRYKSYINIYNLSDINSDIIEPIKSIEWTETFKPSVLKWLDNNKYIIACDNGTIIIKNYDDDNFSEIYNFHTNTIKSIVFNKSNTIMLTSSLDTTSKEIDLKTWKVLRTYQNNNPINYAIYNYNERKVILGGGIEAMMVAKTGDNDLTIKFFKVSDQKIVNKMSSHFGPIRYLDQAPNNKNFVSASQDGIAKIYIFEEDDVKYLELNKIENTNLIDEITTLEYPNAKISVVKKQEKNNYIPGMAKSKESNNDNELFTFNKNYLEKKIDDIKIDPDNPEIYKPTIKKPSTIIINNLPKDITKYELYELFEFYGKIEENGINIKNYYDNTIAFVRYSHIESAEKAINILNRKAFGHNILSVEFAKEKI